MRPCRLLRSARKGEPERAGGRFRDRSACRVYARWSQLVGKRGRFGGADLTLLFTDMAGPSAIVDEVGDHAADEARPAQFLLLLEVVGVRAGRRSRISGSDVRVVIRLSGVRK